MKEIIKITQNPSVVKEVDVLVIGGGPAGIAAALSAAKKGVKVGLVERYGFLGGNATASLVGPLMTSFSADGETQLVKGVFDEVIRRMEDMGGAVHPEKVRKSTPYSGYRSHGHDHVTPFDPEYMKFVTMEMMVEHNVHMFLHTLFVDVVKESDNKISGVLITSKSGLQLIKAKTYIDCSADGDVANMSGVPMKVGRDSDGKTQPMTLFFRMANINDNIINSYRESHPEEGERLFSTIVDKAIENGDWPVQRDKVAMYKTLQPGVWRFNMTRVQNLDGTKAEDLTQAELEGRRQVFHLIKYLRTNIPGFNNATLMDTASQIGVRETRRITGHYELKLEDLTKPTHFEDVIGLGSYPVDIHNPTGNDGGCTDEFPTANSYEIPYRSLVPVKINNLLVAGRCISASHEALSAVRIMSTSFAMGQAVGVAAAMCIEDGIIPSEVNIDKLKQELLKQNVYLGDKQTVN